jgi:cell division protein FtsL
LGGALPPIGSWPPDSPERTRQFDATTARDRVMANDTGRISTVVLERANQLSEKAILCSLITTVFVVGIAMIKSIPGL